MKVRMRLAAGAALLGGVFAAAASLAADYTWNVGPNYVDMSGTSCRATLEESEASLWRAPGEVAISGTSSRRVVCPINRRSSSFYQRPSGNVAESYLTVNSISVAAQDNSSTGNVSCFAYADRLTTNSVIYGPTKFLCSSSGGCTSSQTFSGTNDLSLAFPSFNDKLTVNFGVMCDVAGGSKVLYSQTSISPNQ